MAHAENAENADFASRYALAASGMYTLGETPTAVSDSDAAHSVKVCEVCVRQKKISVRQDNQLTKETKNQREGNGISDETKTKYYNPYNP